MFFRVNRRFLTGFPPSLPRRGFNSSIERREGCHHQKQKRIRRGVQSEIKKTVHQHRETTTQRRQRDRTSKIILRLSTLDGEIKQQHHKAQRQESPKNASIRKHLQIIVVCLLESKEAVACIKTCVDNTEGAQPGADNRMRLNNLECYRLKMRATSGRIVSVDGIDKTINRELTAQRHDSEKQGDEQCSCYTQSDTELLEST